MQQIMFALQLHWIISTTVSMQCATLQLRFHLWTQGNGITLRLKMQMEMQHPWHRYLCHLPTQATQHTPPRFLTAAKQLEMALVASNGGKQPKQIVINSSIIAIWSLFCIRLIKVLLSTEFILYVIGETIANILFYWTMQFSVLACFVLCIFFVFQRLLNALYLFTLSHIQFRTNLFSLKFWQTSKMMSTYGGCILYNQYHGIPVLPVFVKSNTEYWYWKWLR